MKVTIRHIRQARMCTGGGRAFFKKHDLDWSDFLKNGIDIEKIESLNDSMADQVVAITIKNNTKVG